MHRNDARQARQVPQQRAHGVIAAAQLDGDRQGDIRRLRPGRTGLEQRKLQAARLACGVNLRQQHRHRLLVGQLLFQLGQLGASLAPLRTPLRQLARPGLRRQIPGAQAALLALRHLHGGHQSLQPDGVQQRGHQRTGQGGAREARG